jgi:hypothetical protein
VDIDLFSLTHLCFSHDFFDSGIPFCHRKQTGPPCIRSACLLQHQKYKTLVWGTLSPWESRRPMNMVSDNPKDSRLEMIADQNTNLIDEPENSILQILSTV